MIIAYINNTKVDVSAYHNVIMAAIKNDGKFDDDFFDIFTLSKLVGRYVLDFKADSD